MSQQSNGEPFIRFDQVTLDYQHEGRKVRAVENLDLSVNRGEFVVVAGPSGCGKTTLLKTLAGLLLPTEGSVTVAGKRITGPSKIVGMAFQNPILLPWRNVLDNILLPLEIVTPHKQRFRRERGAYAQQARQLLASVGLPDFGERHPWQLSGGQQQRVSLCRAMIHQPQLLLLDEPFGALDAFTREDLWQVLQQVWLQFHFTVLLVTHDLREAIFLADTVYVMSQRPGRLIHSLRVDLPRPRSLEDTFKPAFTELYHEIRRRIGEVREC